MNVYDSSSIAAILLAPVGPEAFDLEGQII
jgi:hypothetical protein